MNIQTRLDMLEQALQPKAPEEAQFVFIRIVSPETKGAPMRFALYENQSFEREIDETEAEFDDRIKKQLQAMPGEARSYSVIFSPEEDI